MPSGGAVDNFLLELHKRAEPHADSFRDHTRDAASLEELDEDGDSVLHTPPEDPSLDELACFVAQLREVIAPARGGSFPEGTTPPATRAP